jgi:hypothetical protein
MACRAGEHGPIACTALMAPSPLEKQGTHNFYTWYGIHGFEMLVAVMGTGVEKVSCFRNGTGDVINAVWKDGRMGEQIGNQLRTLFPSESVYVHFYTPRWICRMGNYRTYEEAHHALQEVKKMGYTAATIVKGKTAVAY